MGLTDEQKVVVEAPLNQNIYVSACPGSGKTTIMIHRIHHMIKECGVDPKSIGMFTYNRSLAVDMSNKLQKLEINTKELFFCGTIHAFCYQNTNDPHDLQPWIEKFENNNSPRYNARGFPTGYDSRNSLKYVIFDEFQDSDPDIAGVVKILSKDRNLMIVGDSRQQLYAYRGADTKHLLGIKDDFVEYTLSKSFRCNQNICALLNKFWANVDAPAAHAAIHSEIEGPRPTLYRSRGSAMNNPNITNEIIELVKKYQDGSIAIISPTVNSDTSRRFLNDIHSNIFDKCKVKFDFSEDNKESKYIISSVHASKGLEYDTVILLNAIDNKYYFDCPTHEAQCKLFVACSRPRQNLILFEHNYHFTNGSIKWITENENLFDKSEDKMWDAPIRQRPGDIGNNKIEKNCRDYIRGFTNNERRTLLNRYGQVETIKVETGLGGHVGEPALSGQLVELMLATKLHFDIKFEFRPYVTSDEWTQIMRSKEIPSSVMDKIKKVYPYDDIDIRRKVEGGKARIVILFIDKMKLLNSWNPVIDESMVETREITENHIISNFMCDEYYKNIDTAHDTRTAVLGSKTCNENYVENLWWLLRFRRLMDMSLTGFNQPDLTQEEIEKVLNYVNQSKILSDLNITDYHTHYRNLVPSKVETWINGEVDFESRDGIIELKCIKEDNLEEAWLQVMVYNQIAEDKYNKVYVYNAITGTLYQRKLKTII